jgi:hypothetical protein
MKKIVSNYSGAALEIARHITYSLKVLMIGLFVPFLFIFGITYNRTNENTEIKTNLNKESKIISGNTVAWPLKDSSYQNS